VTLPATWQKLSLPVPIPGAEAFCHESGLKVIVSIDQNATGPKWMHVSCSRRGRLPSWDDLKMVKAVFIGAEKEAFQVLAPDSEWVDLHKFTLHLWHCMDGRRVQDP
jgi:hypothetical protein